MMTSATLRAGLTAVGLAFALGAAPTSASAQSLTDLPYVEWQVGGMAWVMPKYEGSKSYQVTGFPLLIPSSFNDDQARVSVKALDDIRFRLLGLYGFELGAVSGWRWGRDESDGDRLIGLGDIDQGLVVGGYLGYRHREMLLSASYATQVTGDDDAGALVRLTIENKWRPVERVTVQAMLGATWADDNYMTTYFGVPVSAATATRPAYSPSAGFKDVNFTMASDVALDGNWTLKFIGRYSYLLGDAADSPIVETPNQFYGGIGLTYRFDMRPFKPAP